MPQISPEALAALRKADTPTVCNALEHVMGGRTAEGFTKHPVVCADPKLPAVVGFARTAKIRASSRHRSRRPRFAPCAWPITNMSPAARAERRRHRGHRLAPCHRRVLGRDAGAQHKGLGVAGTLTNGVLRDLGMLDEGYQVIAGAIGPSHAFVHVTELDCPVTVFGMTVRPNDLIHADRHGGVVIPAEHIERMPWAIDVVMRKEVPILTAARAPGFTVEKLKAAWIEADQIK